MISYYQVLRMTPEKDVEGKSEEEILKKIKNNYSILMLRASDLYPDEDEREKIMQAANQALAVLGDPSQREAYLKVHKNILMNDEAEKVSATYVFLEDGEVLLDEDSENGEEGADNPI